MYKRKQLAPFHNSNLLLKVAADFLYPKVEFGFLKHNTQPKSDSLSNQENPLQYEVHKMI